MEGMEFTSGAGLPDAGSTGDASGRVACPRCGTFVDRIHEEPIGVCEACAQRLLIEPLRGPLTAGSVASAMFELMKTIGPIALLITLAFEVPGVVFFAIVPEAPFTVQTLYGLFTLVGELAVLVLAHEALHGRTPSVSAAFSRGLSRYGAVFVTRWTIGWQTLGWLFLLILPGIYKSVQYSIGPSVALFEEASGTAAVKRSMDRTTPHLLLMGVTYGVAILGFLVWNFAGGMVYALLLDPSVAPPEIAALDPTIVAIAFQAVTQLPTAAILLTATLAQQIFYEKLTLDARHAELSGVGA